MQANNSSTVFYSPSPTPNDPADLPRYLRDEFQAIQNAIMQLAAGHLDMVNAVPAKPRDGDIRFADGTNWNPGSGKGFYGYYNSAWHFLG